MKAKGFFTGSAKDWYVYAVPVAFAILLIIIKFVFIN